MHAKWKAVIAVTAFACAVPALAADRGRLPTGQDQNPTAAQQSAGASSDLAAGGAQTGSASDLDARSSGLRQIEGKVVQVRKRDVVLDTGGSNLVTIQTRGVILQAPLQEGQQVRASVRDFGGGTLRAQRIWLDNSDNAGTGGSGWSNDRWSGESNRFGPSGANEAQRSGDLGSGAPGTGPTNFGDHTAGPDSSGSGIQQSGSVPIR